MSSSWLLLAFTGCCSHGSIAVVVSSEHLQVGGSLITSSSGDFIDSTIGLQLDHAAKGMDIYNADAENDTQNTGAWVESVLGPRRPTWQRLVSGRGTPPPGGKPPRRRDCVLPEDEVRNRTPCSQRQAKCRDAQRYLTTASCVPAAGYKGENHQVCHFRNLYSSGDPKVHSLVAHLVKTLDSAFPMEHVCNVRSAGTYIHSHVFIQHHASLEAFADFVEGVPVLTNLTLAFAPHCQNNIGHAFYDSLYPAFVSLLQLGRHEASYRTLLLQGPPRKPERSAANEDIFAVIGGSSINSTYELHRVYRFEEVIVGDGPNSAENDININFTLGCGRSLGAAGLFRDRIYRSFGLTPPLKRTVSSDGRKGKAPLQGILIDNPGHMQTGKFAKNAVTLAASVGVNLTRISWMNPVLFPSPGGKYTSPGPDRFRQHLRLLAKTDIQISGPGTTMMYQQLLPDGSVVVNLADSKTGNTMEEYMAEGAPYLRAIYALPHPGVMPTAPYVVLLAMKARDAILAGFPTSGVTGANLSPSAAVLKAYAHLEYMPGFGSVDPLTPLRKLETFACNPGAEGTISTALLRSPCEAEGHEHAEKHTLMDRHMLSALRDDFDAWHKASQGWFQSVGNHTKKEMRALDKAKAAHQHLVEKSRRKPLMRHAT